MPFRALVIDDHAACRDILHHVLRGRGYEVVCFADPTFCEACSGTGGCTREMPCADLLLTDNRMPGISGLELLNFQKNRGCKIDRANKAILSGAWSSDELQHAESFGCRIFNKPYELKEVFDWLEMREKLLPQKNWSERKRR